MKEVQEAGRKHKSLPSLGLSLGSVLGGMLEAGGPYWEEGLIWGRGSYLFSTGLTFSTDSTLQHKDTNDIGNQNNINAAAVVHRALLL